MKCKNVQQVETDTYIHIYIIYIYNLYNLYIHIYRVFDEQADKFLPYNLSIF